jgi:hypothetical protein
METVQQATGIISATARTIGNKYIERKIQVKSLENKER